MAEQIPASPAGTCPEPGGCESCPYRSYCAGLRVGIGLTALEEEFVIPPTDTIQYVQKSGKHV